MSPLDSIISRVNEIGQQFDCGDSSCLFAETKKGMRTNGGCRCLEKVGSRTTLLSHLKMLFLTARQLRDGLKDAERLKP